MKKIGKRGILSIVGCALICIILFFVFKPSSIVKFNDESRKIEINSIVDYNKFIDKVLVDQDIEIDDSNVHYDELGKYDVIYKAGDKQQKLTIEIVDTVKPEVTLKPLTVIYDYDLKADELIKEVKDATATTASFKKNYSFTNVGENEVEVEVKDEGGNVTVEKTIVTVLEKDEEKPVIKESEVKLYVDSKLKLIDQITVTDNQDKNVKVDIDESSLDRSKIGDYQVKVTATDASNNVNEKNVTVHVIERDKNEKIVYLTFDDGPSQYTPKVLDILDKYDIKATFFVTAQNPKYYDYIKKAYDKGHTIGLHSYTHKYSIYKSTDTYFDDLEKISDLVEKQIGIKVNYIRFPGGSSNTISRKYSKGIMSKLVKMVEEKGYRFFDWNCENGDGYTSMAKKKMISLATSSKANHVMILMHDANGKQNTVDTLSEIIEYYSKKGYEFKAIDEDTPDFHQHVNN